MGKGSIAAAGKSAAKQFPGPKSGTMSPKPSLPKPTAGSHKPSAGHKSIKGR